MITVVQLRVLRQMLDANVFLSRFGEAFFEGRPDDVRKQTVVSLVKKGLIEVIVGDDWLGSEYQITDAGRKAVGVNTPSLARVRKELVLAISIMDEKGYCGSSQREWDTVRQCLFDAIELLEEDVPHGTI